MLVGGGAAATGVAGGFAEPSFSPCANPQFSPRLQNPFSKWRHCVVLAVAGRLRAAPTPGTTCSKAQAMPRLQNPFSKCLQGALFFLAGGITTPGWKGIIGAEFPNGAAFPNGAEFPNGGNTA